MEALTPLVTEMVGGSADLTGSNNTKSKVEAVLTADSYGGRYIHYGVREHGMAAAMNGMALHGGIIPYGGTFLVFTDYCRPAIRLSALMHQRVIYVMTHDSIGLGEDGPTHQPIEHLASLRAMPNLAVYRPADTVETAECWLLALQDTHRPSILSLTRQNLPTLRVEHTDENLSATRRLCAARGRGKPAHGDADCHRLRGRDCGQGAGTSRRQGHRRGRRLDAVLGVFRRAGRGLSPLGRQSRHGALSIEAASPFGWERQVGVGPKSAASAFRASARRPPHPIFTLTSA